MKLRFFCDLCGTEVPRNTVRCPSCGRFFTAIQCPRCHFRGEEKDFEKGCPRCGYMRIPRTSGGAGGGEAGGGEAGGGKKRRRERVKRARRPRPAGSRSEPDQGPVAPAPVGLYRLISIVLVVILVALAVVLLTR